MRFRIVILLVLSFGLSGGACADSAAVDARLLRAHARPWRSGCPTARSRRWRATSTRITDVAIADLVLAQSSVRRTVERLVRDLAARAGRPVGDDLPARHGASHHLARPVARARRTHRRRRLRSEPGAGGVDASRRSASTPSCAEKVTLTFRELVRALERADAARSRRRTLVSRRRRLPTRPRRDPIAAARERRRSGRRTAAARVLTGYTMLGRHVDVVETSRGCTFDCSFCSIIEMRGRNFHRFPIARVIDDIRDARRRGARAIFLVDDNITLDVRAVQGALPGHHRRGSPRRRLHRAGHDRAHRGAWRDARAADAAGGVPLRVPRHRERPRRGSRLPEGARRRTASASRDGAWATPRRPPSRFCASTACSSSAD